MWNLLIPAASAVIGGMQANNKRESQQRYNRGQAETTRYSPWTGMKGQIDNSYSPSSLEGGLAGGIQGLGIAQSLSSLGNGTPSQAFGGGNSTPSSSYLNASNYSDQLGQIGQGMQSSPYANMKPSLYAGGGSGYLGNYKLNP